MNAQESGGPNAPPTPPNFFRFAATMMLLFAVASLVLMGFVGVAAGAGAGPWVVFPVFIVFALLTLGVVVVRALKFFGELKSSMPSPERAAALRLREEVSPDPRPFAADFISRGAVWPAVPALPEPPRPGRALDWELPTDSRPVSWFLGCLVFCVVWDGITGYFLHKAFHGFLQGDPDWVMVLVLIPFVIVGTIVFLGLLVALLTMIVAWVLGPLRVEVSRHPLVAGMPFELLVERERGGRQPRVRLVLSCTEEATYQQGTTTRTERKEVRVLTPESETDQGFRGKVTIPAGAMHSFAAARNKISWLITVKLSVGVFPFWCNYPVIVHPAEGR